MDDMNEKMYGHLRVLSEEEKLAMIDSLQEDIDFNNTVINDKNAYSELKNELETENSFNQAKLNYLRGLLEEKKL